MKDTKGWYQSKTIWGAIISIVATLISILTHKTISPETQQVIVNQIVNIATAVAAIAGGIMAIVGRLKADKIIK